MVHSHTVHLPLGALLSPCTMCGTGLQRVRQSLQSNLNRVIDLFRQFDVDGSGEVDLGEFAQVHGGMEAC